MINKVMLMGRIGQDAEIKFMPNSNPILNVSIATFERWKDKEGNYQEKVEWHRICMFGKRTEALAVYLTKGKLIFVEGKIKYRSYEDKEGRKIYITEIHADNITFCSTGSVGDRKAQDQNVFAEEKQEIDPLLTDNCPF